MNLHSPIFGATQGSHRAGAGAALPLTASATANPAAEGSLMFICTHLDAYEERNRLDQLDHLRVHLRTAIAEQAEAGPNAAAAAAPTDALAWSPERLAALTDEQLLDAFYAIVNPPASAASSVVVTPSTRDAIQLGILRKQAEMIALPAHDEGDESGAREVFHKDDAAWLQSTDFVMMGDFNALKEADYTPAHWLWLTEKRKSHGIFSETALTETVEASVGSQVYHEHAANATWDGESWSSGSGGSGNESPAPGSSNALPGHPGWGLVDARAEAATVINAKGDAKPATSVYGARVDYIYGSPSMMKQWKVESYKHVDMQGLTDHALVVCELVQ